MTEQELSEIESRIEDVSLGPWELLARARQDIPTLCKALREARAEIEGHRAHSHGPETLCDTECMTESRFLVGEPVQLTSSERPAKHQSHCRAPDGFTCCCVKHHTVEDKFYE